MFYQIGDGLKTAAGASEYVIDSLPGAVCDNIRIIRSKILKANSAEASNATCTGISMAR
jgi:hypothetical protein